MYGLSRDSEKSNTSFKQKHSLPYPLICDTQGQLIQTLGFAKAQNKTQRGVIVIQKDGKILEKFDGGPAATLEAIWPVIKSAEEEKAPSSN